MQNNDKQYLNRIQKREMLSINITIQQKFEQNINKGTETQIHVHCEYVYLWFVGAC